MVVVLQIFENTLRKSQSVGEPVKYNQIKAVSIKYSHCLKLITIEKYSLNF